MSNMKHIEVIIAPDGSSRIEGHGFTGPDCEKATAFLERALGKVGNRRRKPEYAQRSNTQQQGAKA
jgi:hypothetical protein